MEALLKYWEHNHKWPAHVSEDPQCFPKLYI